jgi:hypothetical protein
MGDDGGEKLCSRAFEFEPLVVSKDKKKMKREQRRGRKHDLQTRTAATTAVFESASIIITYKVFDDGHGFFFLFFIGKIECRDTATA